MTTAILSIGGNLGDRLETMRSAVRSISALQAVRDTTVSSVYETPPWGPVEQPDFLNAVVFAELTPDTSAIDFLHSLQAIENSHGRTREIHWGPRTLDIDIVRFGDIVSDTAELVLPHPRAQNREFVLVPWLEVQPDAVLPGHGAVVELLSALDPATVHLRSELTLT